MSYRDEWKKAVPGHAGLRELHERLRTEIADRWQRSLPFGEELFDRWERAAHLGFGQGASVYDASVVIGDVRVGEHTWVGPFTILDGSGGLVIGKHCSISAGVQIYTHDTVAAALTAGKAPTTYSSVNIGDCTYVGPNAIITSGVAIGTQCVIGAAALVNEHVPDRSVAFGIPARVVGHVEIDGDDARIVYHRK